MNDQFSDELSQSVDEAIAFLDGKGPTVAIHYAVPRDLRENAGITAQDMAGLTGMKLADYQKWETEFRRLEGAVGSLFLILEKAPNVFKRALLAAS